MPKGFPIDHTKPLNGTMAAYAEQLIMCTGKDDWESRIEDENGGNNLAAKIKKLVDSGDHTKLEIAEMMQISPATLYRVLASI